MRSAALNGTASKSRTDDPRRLQAKQNFGAVMAGSNLAVAEAKTAQRVAFYDNSRPEPPVSNATGPAIS